MVTLGPIAHLGWASASARVALAMRSALHSPKRAARGGDRHLDDRRGIAPAQRLKNRVVLGIHRQQARAGAARRRHHRLAGAHQRFLVGERDGATRVNRGVGRSEPGRADDRRNDEIGLPKRRFDHRLGSGGDFDATGPRPLPSDPHSLQDRRSRRTLRRTPAPRARAPRRRDRPPRRRRRSALPPRRRLARRSVRSSRSRRESPDAWAQARRSASRRSRRRVRPWAERKNASRFHH